MAKSEIFPTGQDWQLVEGLVVYRPTPHDLQLYNVAGFNS
jgi:hypothetical protein